MDKETLSSYGWIVILVLVLSVMLALATPFGAFIAGGIESTTQGIFDVQHGAFGVLGVDIGKLGFDNNDNGKNDTPSYIGGNTEIQGVGSVDVTSNVSGNLEFIYNENTGIIGGIVPAGGEEEIPALPSNVIPETFEFTFGSFESNTTTVEYQTTIVEDAKPVPYGKVTYVYWIYNEDKTIKAPSEATLDTFAFQLSDYVVYNKNTGETVTMEGQTAHALIVYTLNGLGTKENAIYLAAYLNRADSATQLGKMVTTTNYHIAKWNGTRYEEVDCDAQILAVTDFTRTRVITEIKTVSTNTTPSGYTYVPCGTYVAEVGMTWREWLTSDYNTTGKTSLSIKDSNFNNISIDSKIDANMQYGVAPTTEQYVLSGKWTFKETLSIDKEMIQNINFTATNEYGQQSSFDKMIIYTEDYGGGLSSDLVHSIYLSYGERDFWAFQQDFENGDSMDMNWFGGRMIDFGTAPQVVSKAFYEWFMENATIGVENL